MASGIAPGMASAMTHPTGWAVIALALTACAAAPPPAPEPSAALDFAYTIAPAADLETMAVTICGDPLPRRLIPGVAEAAALAADLRVVGGPPLTVRDGGVDLPPGTRCVAYTADLRGAAERGSTADVVRASPGRWMWRPDRLAPPGDLRVALDARLPDGVRLSVPWPRVSSARWHVPWNAFRYRCNALIGRFDAIDLPVPGATLHAAFVGAPRGDRRRFERWLVTAAEEVATVFGAFPVPEAQVVVVFEGGADVGFGATARGGGPGAILYVGRDTSAATLRADWTATHELFHLGMPLIAREDAWLSEGVTTVYTYIAMGRSGRLPPEEVFAELSAGLDRGARFGTGRALEAESAAMHATGAWWRVYWGGGAWALDRMVAMARAGGNFDDVLALWATGALDPGASRRARALLRWADRRVPGHDLLRTAEVELAAVRFPDYAADLAALGVESAGGTTRLGAEGAALRAVLLSPRPPAKATQARRPPWLETERGE